MMDEPQNSAAVAGNEIGFQRLRSQSLKGPNIVVRRPHLNSESSSDPVANLIEVYSPMEKESEFDKNGNESLIENK